MTGPALQLIGPGRDRRPGRDEGPGGAGWLDWLLRVQRARAIGSEGGGFDGLIAWCPQARLRQRVEVPSR